MRDSLNHLKADLDTDTRNVLLTYARVWSTLETDVIRSKPVAALWAMDHLPPEYQIVIERARLICMGVVNEHWDDLMHQVQLCVDEMLKHIEKQLKIIEENGYKNRCIRLDDSLN